MNSARTRAICNQWQREPRACVSAPIVANENAPQSIQSAGRRSCGDIAIVSCEAKGRHRAASGQYVGGRITLPLNLPQKPPRAQSQVGTRPDRPHPEWCTGGRRDDREIRINRPLVQVPRSSIKLIAPSDRPFPVLFFHGQRRRAGSNSSEGGPIMRICSVVGTGLDLLEMAPLVQEMGRRGVEQTLVHSGPADDAPSGADFEELEMPRPDIHLGVVPDTQARQTAAIMVAFEETCKQRRPDLVIV